MDFSDKYFLKPINLVPLILVGLIFLFFANSRSIEVFPNDAKTKLDQYTDQHSGGNSQIISINPHGPKASLDFKFKLGQKFAYPYVGLVFYLAQDTSLVNLSDYSNFKIKFHPHQMSSLKVYLRTHIDGITKEGQSLSYRHLQSEIRIDENTPQTLVIPLTNFSVPLWWFEQNKIRASDLEQESFTQVSNVVIENGALDNLDTPYWLTIESITFTKSWLQPIIYSLIILVVWIIGLLFYGSFRNKPDTVIKITYQKLDLQNEKDFDTKKVLEFLYENYANQIVTLKKVSELTGLSTTRISSIITDKFEMSFPQYLNLIRITEAKRLLDESDLKIIDIAFSTGFNHVSSFNRTFKLISGQTPNEYRKREKNSE
jgi:AraC-like DNA-binding protein